MGSSNLFDRLVLIESQNDDLRVEPVARSDELGDLVLEGWDRGEWVREKLDNNK